MFVFATFIGIYSYGIFLLGLFGFLYKEIIIAYTFLILGIFLLLTKKYFILIFKKLQTVHIKERKTFFLYIFLFSLQVCVNLVGVFGPELAYDALWYHLTLPKLYLLNHAIIFVPGGLLYYSAMPKLAEMLYVAGISFGNEILPKFIHFSFGILVGIALYKVQRKFFTSVISLIGVVIFYSNLVVAWESTTAYVDLIRTFFELMGLWGFITWWESQQRKWLIASALMLGFAITTKYLAIGSLGIFSVFIIYHFVLHKKRVKDLAITLVTYLLIAFIIPLPWVIFSFIHTGNPVYPFFTHTYGVMPEPVNVISFVKDTWELFTKAADPISPLYLIFLPLIIWTFPKYKKEIKVITIYSLLAIIVWYFTPRTGGGRFIVPYLPAFSLVCSAVIFRLSQSKKRTFVMLTKLLLIIIVLISLSTSVYRLYANKKYIPVITGEEKKSVFLSKQLNFSFGDFYDVDNYFVHTIKPTDTVLLYGIHNLYYVDFPFIDSSWVKKGDRFNYILTQNTMLPERFKKWILIYNNNKTMVKFYKAPKIPCSQECIY